MLAPDSERHRFWIWLIKEFSEHDDLDYLQNLGCDQHPHVPHAGLRFVVVTLIDFDLGEQYVYSCACITGLR